MKIVTHISFSWCLEMVNRKRKWPTVIDLFAGCGGVTEALKSRHFRVIAAVDNDPTACRTYRMNHPAVRLYEKDIAQIDPADIKEELIPDEHLDLLVVCAPCQPFSNQGKRDTEDARARLVLHSVKFAKALKPRLILFENVPGIAKPRFVEVFRELSKGLRRIGYRVGPPVILDAADYGVPQRRPRCIMLAKLNIAPPTLPEPTSPKGERVTVKQAIRDLNSLEAGDADPNDPLHFARAHQAIALQRLACIPKDGGSRSSLPNHLVLSCHKEHRGHPDVYGRMHWNDVAPTLTTGCTDITKGRFAHPKDDRAITLREAARLQTFKDDYRFSGGINQIAAQIGNSMPVGLIDALVSTLREGVTDNT